MTEIKPFAASMLDPSAKLCPVQKSVLTIQSHGASPLLSLTRTSGEFAFNKTKIRLLPPTSPPLHWHCLGYIQINKLLLIVFKHQSSSIATFQIHFYHKTKRKWEVEENKIQGFGFKQRIKFRPSKRNCAFKDMNRVARCPFLRVERKGLLY